MARFQFQLAPVLRQRHNAEREQQRAVAELERERLDLEARLRSLSRERDDERAAWASALGSSRGEGPVRLNLGGVRMQAGAALGRELEARRVAVQLAGVYKRLQGARNELIKRAADRRALELLRDRQYEAFREAQDRAERVRLDDLVTGMHAGADAD